MFFYVELDLIEYLMRDLIKRNVVFSLIAVAGLLLGGGMVNSQPVKSASSVDLAKLMQPGPLNDMVEGSTNAPVTIVEYASITCSHCADFYQKTLPQIREKYVKTGKVRLIFREFAYDPRAAAGFMLSRCVAEDRYFPLIQVLFEKQAEWAFVSDAKSALAKIAKFAGLNDKNFEVCLKNQKILDGLNATLQRGRDEFGITVTPTFFINGKRYEGVLSLGQMSAIIENLLK
ncbi:MAG: Protein-disulfide isomerase [Candidatus Tokpelaia sp. JSC189]|nr:MAG: Protein-disulfide isomerase [Candidatus Tokpelaia sp. JSC189]